MSKAKLSVAMIGAGFIANVHSNAFRQVGHFFDIPYDVCCKVICGRNREKLEKRLPAGVGKRLRQTGRKSSPEMILTQSILRSRMLCIPRLRLRPLKLGRSYSAKSP